MGEGGKAKAKRLGEFDIIARYFAPLATEAAALGLKDDAAVLVIPESREVIASCDTLIEGVHFLADDPPETIGYKALAVNLSDLAAKGSKGYTYLLSLSLPHDISESWLEGFSTGLRTMQEESGIALVGGDTTASPGPLTVTITALGLVAHGHAVLRHGAKPGDRLYVSGTIGDAYLGLSLLKERASERFPDFSEADASFLIDRYRRPTPRTDAVIPIRNFAQSAIDVSDGLVLDIEKLCQVSRVGAAIEAARVPFSAAARKAMERMPDLLEALITSGDDYEIVAAVSEACVSEFETEARAKDVPFTHIGTILPEGRGVTVKDSEGGPLKLKRTGFSHF
jgi:thiamine-monophosphate kinase